MSHSYIAAVPVNDESILTKNLRLSPDIVKGALPLIELRKQPSAASAYNSVIDTLDANVLIFAHQDVYLPNGWLDRLKQVIASIESQDAGWGVLGLFGITDTGEHVGHVWSSGLGSELGAPFDRPIPARTIDELVIVLRRDTGLRFSDDLPGFHLYATDICLQAHHRKLGVYVVHAPVVHNSRRIRSLRGQYVSAYRYMKIRYRAHLPINTIIVPITRSELPLWYAELRLICRNMLRSREGAHSLSAQDIARRLGYELVSEKEVP